MQRQYKKTGKKYKYNRYAASKISEYKNNYLYAVFTNQKKKCQGVYRKLQLQGAPVVCVQGGRI